MAKRLWSISALSVELGVDRRTLAKRLSLVRADGKLKGYPAWHLETVLGAIEQEAGAYRGVPGSLAKPPPGFERIEESLENPVDKMAAFVTLNLVYLIAPLISKCAAAAGSTVDTADRAGRIGAAVFANAAFDELRSMGVPLPADADIVKVDCLQVPDRQTLLELASQTC